MGWFQKTRNPKDPLYGLNLTSYNVESPFILVDSLLFRRKHYQFSSQGPPVPLL